MLHARHDHHADVRLLHMVRNRDHEHGQVADPHALHNLASLIDRHLLVRHQIAVLRQRFGQLRVGGAEHGIVGQRVVAKIADDKVGVVLLIDRSRLRVHLLQRHGVHTLCGGAALFKERRKLPRVLLQRVQTAVALAVEHARHIHDGQADGQKQDHRNHHCNDSFVQASIPRYFCSNL